MGGGLRQRGYKQLNVAQMYGFALRLVQVLGDGAGGRQGEWGREKLERRHGWL